MTEAKTNSKSKSNVLSLVYMAMFVAIITVCAQIQIPMTVPFTLQTLGIFMAAAMLGWKRGLISVTVYVLLGAGRTDGIGLELLALLAPHELEDVGLDLVGQIAVILGLLGVAQLLIELRGGVGSGPDVGVFAVCLPAVPVPGA